jgi:hypothetical protein
MSRPKKHYGKWRIRWTDEKGARHAPQNRSGKHDQSIIRCHLRPYPGTLRLRELTVADTDALLVKLAHLDWKTIHNVLTLLISMLNVAVDLGCGAVSQLIAAGIDRDALLTEAPAVPNAGTVRIAGSANGQPSGAADSGSTGGVSGNILWAPLDRVAGDVGLYHQGPDGGPRVRLRFQILKRCGNVFECGAGVGLQARDFMWGKGGSRRCPPRQQSGGCPISGALDHNSFTAA